MYSPINVEVVSLKYLNWGFYYSCSTARWGQKFWVFKIDDNRVLNIPSPEELQRIQFIYRIIIGFIGQWSFALCSIHFLQFFPWTSLMLDSLPFARWRSLISPALLSTPLIWPFVLPYFALSEAVNSYRLSIVHLHLPPNYTSLCLAERWAIAIGFTCKGHWKKGKPSDR